MARDTISFSQAAKLIPKHNKSYSSVVSVKKSNPIENQKQKEPNFNRKEYNDNLMYINGQAGNLPDGFAISKPHNSINVVNEDEIQILSESIEMNQNANVNYLLSNVAKISFNILNSQNDNYATEAIPFLKSLIENGQQPNKN
jgi:hypothetical protein